MDTPLRRSPVTGDDPVRDLQVQAAMSRDPAYQDGVTLARRLHRRPDALASDRSLMAVLVPPLRRVVSRRSGREEARRLPALANGAQRRQVDQSPFVPLPPRPPPQTVSSGGSAAGVEPKCAGTTLATATIATPAHSVRISRGAARTGSRAERSRTHEVSSTTVRDLRGEVLCQ